MKKILFSLLVWLSVPVIASANPISSLNQWVESQLALSGSSPAAYLLLAAGGLLASLLPCVYPLYPITASLVKSRSENAAFSWAHPTVYYVGLSFMYFVFGLIAGVTGGAFNEVLRVPMVNVGLAVLFLILAMATAGFLHIQFLGGAQMGEKTSGLPSTFLMGMGAGLLSSSCVGPFVISILISIASSADGGFSILHSLVAASKMLAFGIGLGIPFLLIGLFGARLPKSGSWMRYVQLALAAMILGFAYVYLEKGLSGMGFSESRIAMIFWGALLVLFAAFKLMPKKLNDFERSGNALLVLTGIIAMTLVFRGFTPEVVSAGSVAAVSGPEMQVKGNLQWFLNREDAIEAARSSGKQVFVDFFGSWCANCKEFEKLTQTNQALNAALADVVLLKVQDTDPEFKDWQQDSRFPELKVGLPFFVIMDADQNLIYKTSDYTRTDEMLMFLEN